MTFEGYFVDWTFLKGMKKKVFSQGIIDDNPAYVYNAFNITDH